MVLMRKRLQLTHNSVDGTRRRAWTPRRGETTLHSAHKFVGGHQLVGTPNGSEVSVGYAGWLGHAWAATHLVKDEIDSVGGNSLCMAFIRDLPHQLVMDEIDLPQQHLVRPIFSSRQLYMFCVPVNCNSAISAIFSTKIICESSLAWFWPFLRPQFVTTGMRRSNPGFIVWQLAKAMS